MPEVLLRGIPNMDFLNRETRVPKPHLFTIKGLGNPPRTDGNLEESINWFDDDEAKILIFNKKKEDGSYQFRAGLVEIKKEDVDNIVAMRNVCGNLSYERNGVPHKYHGNLLLKNTCNADISKMIGSVLALSCSPAEDNPNIG